MFAQKVCLYSLSLKYHLLHYFDIYGNDIFPDALWSYISDGITYTVIWLVLSSIQKKGNQIKIPLWINRWFCLKGLEFPCSVVTQKRLNAHKCACDSTMNAINQTNETKKRSKYFMSFVSFSMQTGRVCLL